MKVVNVLGNNLDMKFFFKSGEGTMCRIGLDCRKLPAALNTGFAEARGEFFTWTSDDNLFRPLAFREMVAALGQDSTLDVVYCDYAFSDSNGRLTGARRVGLPRALVYGNVVGACFLCRRNVHETLDGYDESLFLAEDYDFWLRCAASFAMLPTLLKACDAARISTRSAATASGCAARHAPSVSPRLREPGDMAKISR